jgi:GTP pyrophosphokinase
MTVQAIIKELQPEEIRDTLPEEIVQEAAPFKGRKKPERDNIILVSGADNVLTKISHCCMPVPGDEIVGFITSGRGISVHKASCPNLKAADQQRLIAVSWAEDIKSTHRAQIQVIARDQKGLLATLSNAISHDDANILSLDATTSSGGIAKLFIIVEINSREHLLRLLQHVQQLDGVLEARRT